MTPDEAVDLVLYEGDGGGPEAVFVLFRCWTDPGPDRMRRLIDAVWAVFDSHEGRTQLDRRLAAALWILGQTVWDNYWTWPERLRVLRPELEKEVLELLAAVESVFLGVRCQNPDTPSPGSSDGP